ncbi:SMC-Scp complex subunit ScpB [Luteimonas aquatica]|uniref:SMC-Scp complex subunit ScpB n=1 Tax=Luteimonas aquatica TaxID=450364 RepID=UPI003CE48825
MDQDLIKRIVEAALLAANQPLTLAQLQALLTQGELPLDEQAPDGAVAQALEALQAECAGRGVELVELASGWRFQVKADVHAWVARLWNERQTKYTRATLETLALIAYRQPITRGEIEQVRGVATNSNIIKALEEREWIRVVGHRDIPGRPELLGTTKTFLDYFGLKRLDELPPLSELKDFGELDPQFSFDGKGAAPGEAMPVGDVALDEGADVQADAETDPEADTDTDTWIRDEDGLASEDAHESEPADHDDADETAADGDNPAGDDDGHQHTDPSTEDEDALAEDSEPNEHETDEHALADDGDSSRSTT